MQTLDSVRFEDVPPEQLQALCSTVIEFTREQFRRQEIQEEFAHWKAKRKKRRTSLTSICVSKDDMKKLSSLILTKVED